MRHVAGIPPSMRLCGRAWRIVCTKRRPTWARLEGTTAKDQSALRDLETQQIWIKNDGVIDRMQERLAHEVAHVLLDDAYDSNEILRIAIDGNTQIDEALTEALERPLLSLVRDNDFAWARGNG